MQLWLIMKGTFIIAVVLLELITFVLFQMLWKGDFICETIPIEAPVTASIRYNNLGIIIFLLTSHLCPHGAWSHEPWIGIGLATHVG